MTDNNANPIAHVEFRPMFDFGDYCIISALGDAKYYGVYCAPAGEPVSREEIFDEGAEALDHIFSDPKYVGARKWYNGNEIMGEIEDIDDIFMLLATDILIEDEEFHDLGERLGLDRGKINTLSKAALAASAS